VDTVVALVALGSFHGFNPAMGWLFAVAVGLQRQSRLAVLAPLIPIAIGHEASVTAAAMAFELTASAVAQRVLPAGPAAALHLGGDAPAVVAVRTLVVPHVERARRRAHAVPGARP
jgi:hypothetical protein